MRSVHLRNRLETTYNCVLAALASDEERARLEAGGYLRVLWNDSLGRGMVRRWAADFRRDLDLLGELGPRVVERLRSLTAILRAEVQQHLGEDEVDKLVPTLEHLDTLATQRWFGPDTLDFEIQLGMLADPLDRHARQLLQVLVGLHVQRVPVARVELDDVFNDALSKGDPGDMQSWISAVRTTVARAERAANDAGVALSEASRLAQLAAEADPAPEEIARFVAFDLARLVGEVSRAGGTLSVPTTLSWYRWIGGYREAMVRKRSLAPGPRSAWWSLVALANLASESGVTDEDLAGGDPVLRSVVASLRTGHRDHPWLLEQRQLAGIKERERSVAAALRLELHKVHATAKEDIEAGRIIVADLRRYRQRIEWYARREVEKLIDDAEAASKKATAREAAAVGHLATWLVDQGYSPVAKLLGVDRTDLEAGDDIGDFVIEAKCLTQRTLPKKQPTLDKESANWATQAAAYAGVQGVEVAVVVVFNQADSVQLEGGGPYAVADVNVFYVPVNLTKKTASKKTSVLQLRYAT